MRYKGYDITMEYCLECQDLTWHVEGFLGELFCLKCHLDKATEVETPAIPDLESFKLWGYTL